MLKAEGAQEHLTGNNSPRIRKNGIMKTKAGEDLKKEDKINCGKGCREILTYSLGLGNAKIHRCVCEQGSVK